MNRPLISFGITALLIAGCSGGFSNGTAEPNSIIPPDAPQSVASNRPGEGTPDSSTTSHGAHRISNGSPTPPPEDVSAYPLSQAPGGLACPEVGGVTCTLQFN